MIPILRSVMQKVFTTEFTRARVKAIFNTRKFGDRTTCPKCGCRHKFWKLSDGRWQCKSRDKRFGPLTDTKVNRTELNLQEIDELLFWFEPELTNHKIAERIDANYRKIHRVYNKYRERLKEYEEDSIELLDGEVEVDETYFGADFSNRRRYKREKLRKEGRVKRGRGVKDLKEAVFGIFEREDGIVYIKPVVDVTKDTLQEMIKNKVNIETRIYTDKYRSYNDLEEDCKS